MPQHPAEENTQSHIFDKVAKESSDSTASNHPLHDENKGPLKQATSEDHRSKGPQLSDNLPPAADKEELRAKAREMNK
ncbi:hypothetical protein A1O3_03309 [Capronia epimyces CBS 606.96]|uniref:Uncharacterized protein n=1 Tax=Capronia epimyces CBS 606.96 TaxID=1182542 RepID=W9Y1K4_9EURO|nr:uncharacterized protein A1O3_03309 [Capronia epimyces CBS 606.96]EXJ86358.1 hypothetical protein A1O3_03309 [Capronia epimyces CBS 606.96]